MCKPPEFRKLNIQDIRDAMLPMRYYYEPNSRLDYIPALIKRQHEADKNYLRWLYDQLQAGIIPCSADDKVMLLIPKAIFDNLKEKCK